MKTKIKFDIIGIMDNGHSNGNQECGGSRRKSSEYETEVKLSIDTISFPSGHDLHSDLLSDRYCLECERIIRPECEHTHQEHNVITTKKAICLTSKRIDKELEKLKNLLRYASIVIHDLQHNIDRSHSHYLEISKELFTRAQMLSEDDMGMVDDLLNYIKLDHDTELARMETKIQEFNSFISTAKSCILTSERLVASLNSEGLISDCTSMVKSIRDVEISLPECLSERSISQITSIPEVKNDVILTPEEILGIYSKDIVPWRIEVKRITSFRPDGISARCVTTMCRAENGEVLVVWQWGPLIYLVNKDGTIKKSVDMESKMDCICTLKEGYAVSCHLQKCIKVLSHDFVVLRTFETALIPRGIFSNSQNEVFICEVENMHRKANDKNKIVRLDVSSGSKTVIPCGDNLLQPCRITVNDNDEICVSDRNKGCIVIFHQDGSLKSEYSGPSLSTRHRFAPESIRCDRFGQILCVDYTNHTVHVLDPIGRFRGFLIMDTEIERRSIFMGTSSPFSLTIDSDGDLWVGNKFGYLTVLKYFV
ncbi:uncharacterized protein LOC127872853 isoform X1 [Dreissena polymorpha]|uniref:uncharacterized protein LOC127872853 isoform X1 n=1 Tax=Dreissena polymorpha TaxID=45954 RepID=UPI002264D1B5|nr:uncharacterized protein LOC127872853 isoform X1 [Dreissena polymorpha]